MTRLTRPARLSASANEPPIRPQPITPSCSNIVGDSARLSDVDGIGAEQLEEGAQPRAVLRARAATCGWSGWPCEVDVEVVLPLARSAPAATRSASSTRRAASAARSMSCTAPGRFGTETTRLVQSCPDAFGCGCALGMGDDRRSGCGCAASSWIAGATTCRPYSLAGALARDRRRAPGRGRRSRAPSALLATGRRSTLGQVVAQPGMALGERLRMRADGVDAVERVVAAQQVVAHAAGWSRRR